MNLHIPFLGLLALACGFFCLDRAQAASGRITIESGGVARSALLVEHARLKKTRRPVVIVLHAGGGNALRSRHVLGLEERTRSSKPVMVYPDAIGGRWSDVATAGDNRDTVFIRDLIAKLISEGIADRHHIFILGNSSGGMLAMKLACSGDEFAGVVASLTALPAELMASCKIAKPTPFLLIAGTADPTVAWGGGAANLVDVKTELLAVAATLDLFAKAAGCAETKTTVTFADHDTRDKSRAYLDKLAGCKVPVELLRIEGGGHLLPRTSPVNVTDRAPEAERVTGQGMRNRDVDAPALIWDFLRHLGA